MKKFQTGNKMEKIKIKRIKPRNLIAMDLHTSKYRMRVVSCEKVYKRTKLKQELKRELAYG
jgi:hypothetical protein